MKGPDVFLDVGVCDFSVALNENGPASWDLLKALLMFDVCTKLVKMLNFFSQDEGFDVADIKQTAICKCST
jgi:hypothetical protein